MTQGVSFPNVIRMGSITKFRTYSSLSLLLTTRRNPDSKIGQPFQCTQCETCLPSECCARYNPSNSLCEDTKNVRWINGNASLRTRCNMSLVDLCCTINDLYASRLVLKTGVCRPIFWSAKSSADFTKMS